MTITQPLLNEGQKMIYGRKRILDTFYKTHPVGKDIMEDNPIANQPKGTNQQENKAPWWQRFAAGLNEFYHAPYRQTMARAARDEEDFFMLMMFAESLGIDNPASFYTLELQPLFLENFHEWHTRMGMDRCPFDHVGCC